MGTSIGNKPQMPRRKWYQYIPFLSKGYDDQVTKYQNDLDEYRWKQENAYNSPASQVQRYMEAGLNPGLMYGQGDSGNASSMQAANRPEGAKAGINPLAMLNGVLQTSLLKQNVVQAQEKANQEHIRTMDAKNVFDNRWTQNIDLVNETVVGPDGVSRPLDVKNMNTGQKEMFYNLKQSYYKADSAKKQNQILDKALSWYTWSQISSLFGGVGGSAVSLLRFL